MTITKALVLAVLPALTLTACSSPARPTAGALTGAASSAAASPSPSASRTGAAPPTSAASQTDAATPTDSTTPTPRPSTSSAGPSRCPASVLRASQGRAEGSAGHFHVALLLTNRGDVPCVLDGYPGVSFTAGSDAHQIGSPAQRDRRYPATPVTLKPGATGHATVTVANYGVYDESQCRPARSTGYRVYPPGSTGSLLVTAPGTVCSRPGVQEFGVTVVRTGSTPD